MCAKGPISFPGKSLGSGRGADIAWARGSVYIKGFQSPHRIEHEHELYFFAIWPSIISINWLKKRDGEFICPCGRFCRGMEREHTPYLRTRTYSMQEAF